MNKLWTRRDFLQKTSLSIGGGALALSTLSKSFAADSTGKRPNILWIVSEDNDPFLGCYGDKNATTPNIDRLAREGIVYDNALSNAPVCAPARNTIITGMYPPNLGTMHMRSKYAIPERFKFFPQYLRAAGYYCTNNAKEDYNTFKPDGVWDESSHKAHYKNRKPGQPFFAVFNINISHEHVIHFDKLKPADKLMHKPQDMVLPPYHPDLPEIRLSWANYYDYITEMDHQVGQRLKELEDMGLADDTIVFYYSDNGGVLPRSKRFLYESGTRIAMVVRIPKKWRHLATKDPGSREERLVQFVDLAPTVLSLAGIPKPAHMQGRAFLGTFVDKEPEFAYCYRDRMDERYDMMRSVRSREFLYIRNYYPDRIYGQHLWYLWRAPATRAWQKAYLKGKCNEVQSRFWQPKPVEELYDIKNDPHNVHNLAANPEYKTVLNRFRSALKQWVRQNRDAGFLPEGWMMEQSKKQVIYNMTHDANFPMGTIIETAELASERRPSHLPVLTERLRHEHPAVRYWAAVGCRMLGAKARQAQSVLTDLLADPVPEVRIAAAEALCRQGSCTRELHVLLQEMHADNPRVQLRALNVLDALGEQARPVLKKIMGISPWAIKTDGYFHQAHTQIIKNLKPGWEDYIVW